MIQSINWEFLYTDDLAEEKYTLIIDGEESTAYVIETEEDEEYTFDDETPFDVYTVDVSFNFIWFIYEIDNGVSKFYFNLYTKFCISMIQ